MLSYRRHIMQVLILVLVASILTFLTFIVIASKDKKSHVE